MLLVTHGQPTMERHAHPSLGRLIQPRHYSSVRTTAESGITWAADNDAFGGWDAEREARFVKMLAAIEGLPGCRFVCAPDVVGDSEATLALFEKWGPRIRAIQPVALVAQDGLSEPPWDEFDALFIGGTTEFKLSPEAAEFAREAKRRGKWVHMGRVNTLRRIRYAGSIGCDSVDGSKFSRWIDRWLPEGLTAVSSGDQGRLVA
jgi:hypothetical protein